MPVPPHTTELNCLLSPCLCSIFDMDLSTVFLPAAITDDKLRHVLRLRNKQKDGETNHMQLCWFTCHVAAPMKPNAKCFVCCLDGACEHLLYVFNGNVHAAT